MGKAKILVVDDDEALAEMIGIVLRNDGFEPAFAADGTSALPAFHRESPDLVLLDLMLPGIDGIEVCRLIRAESDVPIVMLTAKSDTADVVRGLESGADDYVPKPFKPAEVTASIQTILRRSGGGRAAKTLRVGPLEVQLENYLAAILTPSGKRRLDLTLTEFNIVRLMATRPGEDISYREIYDLVHGKGFVAGYGPAGYRANVRAFIKRIRQKFRMVDGDFDLIDNYPGFGYRWSDDPVGGGMDGDDDLRGHAGGLS